MPLLKRETYLNSIVSSIGMAKGRKVLQSSRSERLLGYNQSSSNSDASEFDEEDVWSMIDDVVNHDHQHIHHSEQPTKWNSDDNRSHHSDHHSSGLSLAFDELGRSANTSSRIIHQFNTRDKVKPRVRHLASSAPVNVPNWGKIYRVDSVESLHESDDGSEYYDSERIPPHEYLARSRNSAATSVFEGVGRTLKGRDLSRVRDAVWSQTGYDG